MMFNIGLSNVASAPSNAPESQSSYGHYLANCASKLDSICSKDIYFAVFFGNTTVIEDCCNELVYDVGKVCHDDMTKYVLTKTKFRSNNAQILKRSEKVWNDCVAIES